MPTPSGLVTKQELIDAQLDTAHLGRVVNSKDASGAPINTSTNRTGGVNKTLDALEAEYLEAIRAAGGVSIGTWTAGVTTFNAYNEYAVYAGIPYKPRTAATLPYVAQGADPTAAPDDANVQPYQEVTEAQVVTLVEENAPKVSGAVFANIPDLRSGIMNNGSSFDFSAFPEYTRLDWLGYYVRSDGGSNWGLLRFGPHTEDGGKIFSIDANTYVEANNPKSLLKWGVKTSSGTLDLQEAANNRQQTERMLRNPDISSFIFNNEGTVNILGSVHPLRVDIEIDHRKGCNLAGYLNDPSLPEVLSGGHMIGFAQYQNPDDKDDPNRFVITGPTTNLIYNMSGTVETIFRVEHDAPHNNNCLGFAWSENCSVIGKGGVKGSDHRGINFDYDAENCVVDLGFIKGTSNEPVLMRGNSLTRSEYNKVKIRVVETLFDSGVPSNYRVVDIRNTERAVIQINSMKTGSAVKPNLTYIDNCGLTTIEIGTVKDVAQVARFIDSQSLTINGVLIDNADCLVARAGGNTSEMKNVVINDVQCTGVLPSIYRDDRAPVDKTNGFELLSVHNCDFSEVTGVTEIWDAPVGAAAPKVYSIRDNATHPGWSSPQIFNELSYSEFITPAVTSFSYDIEGVNNDYPYSKLQGRITQGATAYQFEFDLTVLARTGFNQIVSVFHESGARMEVSTSKGVGQLVTFTLDNAGTGSVFSDIIIKN